MWEWEWNCAKRISRVISGRMLGANICVYRASKKCLLLVRCKDNPLSTFQASFQTLPMVCSVQLVARFSDASPRTKCTSNYERHTLTFTLSFIYLLSSPIPFSLPSSFVGSFVLILLDRSPQTLGPGLLSQIGG